MLTPKRLTLSLMISSDRTSGAGQCTRRRSGQVATSPRNIIDSGELLNSKVGPTKGRGNAYVGVRKWVWNSPYASLVKTASSPVRGQAFLPVTGLKPR